MNKRIVIFGNGQAPLKSLTYLIQNKFTVLVVVDPNDTSLDSWQKSLSKFCINNSVPFLKPSSYKNINFYNKLLQFNPNIILSIQCRNIINKEIIKLVNGRIYNFHFSNLPLNRGCYPIVWHILNEDKFTAVTLHKLTPQIDDGDIIDKIQKKIILSDTSKSIYFWSINQTFTLLKRNLNKLLKNSFVATRQNEKKSSYYSRKSLNFNDTFVNWNQSAKKVSRFIQAFIFPPYQYPKSRYKNKTVQIIAVNKIQNQKRDNVPGTIIYNHNHNLLVQCKDGQIEIQLRNNKNRMSNNLYI